MDEEILEQNENSANIGADGAGGTGGTGGAGGAGGADADKGNISFEFDEDFEDDDIYDDENEDDENILEGIEDVDAEVDRMVAEYSEKEDAAKYEENADDDADAGSEGGADDDGGDADADGDGGDDGADDDGGADGEGGADATDWKAEYEALKKEHEALKKEGAAALKHLGYDGENVDVMQAFESISAEGEDIPLSEYQKNKAAEAEKENAAVLAFENAKKQDIEEIHSLIPSSSKFKALEDFGQENYESFLRLRASGVSAKKAYLAIYGEELVASAAKRNSGGGKDHLTPAVARNAKSAPSVIPARERRYLKETFPDLTDRQLEELYTRTK